MTETLPVKLSPLGLHLTKLFHKEKEPTKTKAPRPKRQRIVTVTEVIEATPPRASAPKVPVIESTTATEAAPDRKSTRLNSSHSQISYAVFCLKKKKKKKYKKNKYT